MPADSSRPLDTVDFRRPALTWVARWHKQLDLRVGRPMSVGAVYEGREGRLRLPFRVSAAETFPSISAVWSTLTRRGQTHLLFPPGLQADLGVPVHTSADAARLYATLTGITQAVGEFTLYTLQALKGEPPDAGGSSPICLLYTSPSPRDRTRSRMPSSA